MLRKDIQKKLLAIILIFTLTFANFAVVTKAYAASIVETFLGTNSDTGHKNVEFDSYFETEGNNTASVISDVNNKDLAIKFDLGVNDSGYLKNAKIELLESNGEELSFKVKDYEENSETISNEIATEDEEVVESEEIKTDSEDEILETSEEVNEVSEEMVSEETILNDSESADDSTDVAEESNIEGSDSSDFLMQNEEETQVEEPEAEVVEEQKTEVIEEAEIETHEPIISEYVQSFEENIISLKQINSTSEVNINLPIEYKNLSYVNEDTISNEFEVRFSGIYVDSEGKETAVEKIQTLTIDWVDNREVKVETAVEKYIDFGAGVILQTLIRVDTREDSNRLPIKEESLEIKAPALGNVYPSNVLVVANSLEGINGQIAGNIIFSDNNWKYEKEENKLEINVHNEKKLVKESEYNEDFLKDGEEKEDERLYNGSGIDEFLITYTYPNVSIEDIEDSTTAIINAKVLVANSGEKTSENSYEYEISEPQGEIVSLNKVTETEDISKAYEYINYNNNGKYEIEVADNTVINVSYKNIIENIKVEDISTVYVSKDASQTETDDIYYKKVEINKDNFDMMLGEAGEIKVLDLAGNLVGTIDSSISANEEGILELNIEGRYSKLVFEISKPVAEGNLVIRNVKALGNLSIDKASLVNMSEIKSKSLLKANYEYVDAEVEIGEKESVTLLKDTTSKAKLIIDRDSLSTLSENKDVEIRIELNNASLESDIYGHSVFEVELPEYIESLEITNTNILFGEGLNISEIIPEGRTIRITLDGVQEGINTGIISNGTNIVLNANIKVNLYTPAKKELVKLRYVNDEATNYSNNAEDSFEIAYSAPTGLVAVNSITGFGGEDSIVQSVRQGEQTELIDIFAESKVATEEIIVMNNNGNTVSDVSVLGRFPFKGVKDILTGDGLGTTIDVRIINGIMSDERNNTNVRVYYSENAEADKDLNNSLNGWIENPETLEGMKSYLIVPEEGYIMNDAEVLRFTYEYEIPENLNHNETIAGTFMVDYTNNSEILVTNEKEEADIVGLTTGEGPEFNIEVLTNKTEMKEYEELEVTVKAKNIGNNKIQNVVSEFPIPAGSKYVSNDSDNVNITVSEDNKLVTAKLDELGVNEELEYKVNVRASGLSKNISKETGIILKPTTSVNAKDLGATLNAAGENIKVNKSDLRLVEDNRTPVTSYTKGSKLSFSILLENVVDRTLNNVVVTQALPEELKLDKAYITKFDTNKNMEVNIGEGTYEDSNRTITYKLDSLESGEYVYLKYEVEVQDFKETTTKINLNAVAKADGTEIYESNVVSVELVKPLLEVTQTSSVKEVYVKDGSTIDYIYTIKNIGSCKASNLKFEDIAPEGLKIEKILLRYDDEEDTEIKGSPDKAVYIGSLETNTSLTITVRAKAVYLESASERTVVNSATITADNITAIKTEPIINIIESSLDLSMAGTVSDGTNLNEDTQLKSNSTTTDILKTYKIEGTAWEDKNKDGCRNTDEQLLSGIVVKLVDNDTGVIQKTITTDFNGNYSFSGLPNGNYLVIFEYDTVRYAVTAYQKEGVDANVNSDAISTMIEQDGKSKYAAITDIININNGSTSGVDIGLMNADAFDLELEKTISKVTVQTTKGSSTESYNNVKLAKTEIASKNVSGASVIVEYTIKVSNIGDISGYAKKIVDYIPEDMKFNSSLGENSKWYTGTDGKLYTTAFADTELVKGESRTIKLVLTKDMTEDNTGIVNNLAEIYEDYNIYGISDRNSTVANKAQGENDLGSADMVILIKTGETLIYISVIITTILIMTIAVLVIGKRIIVKKNEEGGV